ncbi:MAG: hypothetical protein IKD20_04495 [Clostridia bacterium]|nr:hypothetical protein [Clostridia bacterium]
MQQMQDIDYRSNSEKREDWFIEHKATIWIASAIATSLAIIYLMAKGKANDVVSILLFYIIGLILWQIRERFREPLRSRGPFALTSAFMFGLPFAILVELIISLFQ